MGKVTFSPYNDNWKIIQVGCGGTGSLVVPDLARLIWSVQQRRNNSFSRGYSYTLIDGDRVEARNVVRQHFTSADVGRNKALVLAERYGRSFDLPITYLDSYLEREKDLTRMFWGNVLLIGCVDNNATRQIMHQTWESHSNYRTLVWIDAGNGEYDGQVVMGMKNGQEIILPPVTTMFPEILTDDDKLPTQQSCGEAVVANPQNAMANRTAATIIMQMVNNILALGLTQVHATHFNCRTAHSRPVWIPDSVDVTIH